MEAARMEGIIVRVGVMKSARWPHAPTGVMSQTLKATLAGGLLLLFCWKSCDFPHWTISATLPEADDRNAQFLPIGARSGVICHSVRRASIGA